MPDCPTCGARVLIVRVSVDEETAAIALDSHEAGFGPRYAIWDDGSVHPVAATAQVLAHPVHVCAPPMPR